MSRYQFSQPLHVSTWMAVFLAMVALLAAFLAPRLSDAFMANVGFNGVILGVLALGIAVNLRQVWRLQREVNWIEVFLRSDTSRVLHIQPVLLAPMAQLLASHERGTRHLSPASMRSILDSVQIRLEEQRDFSRYLIGLLIFLGLLGTFWGLLVTIASVGDIIAGLAVGQDPLAMFEALKGRLKEPLEGMATSFSTSLFGLSGSLVVGFLDLQSGHAQNRFYNELEEWLSEMTRLPSGFVPDGEGTLAPAYLHALLEQTAEGLEQLQRSRLEADRERRSMALAVQALGEQIGRLGETLFRENRSEGPHIQEEWRTLMRQLLEQSAQTVQSHEELRAELRLLSRTLAAALADRKGH
jgi:hypothetical protein